MDAYSGIHLHNFEAIFKKYYGSLCYYATRYVVDVEVSADLVQDVFVNLLETSNSFKSAEHLRNYLYLAVRNSCLNYLHKNELKERHEHYVRENEPLAEFPDEEVLTAEVYRRLKEAVDELPLECRKILYLSYFDGVENERIAEQLQISVNTVRAQKMRGKKLLKMKLGNLLPLLFLFPELLQ